MNNRGYYVDSCVYLNLWNKEIAENGFPYWEFADRFFKKVEERNLIVYYSGYLLKELSYVLGDQKFIERLSFFNPSYFKRISLTKDEYNNAKNIHIDNREISFYDVVHMLLSKKTNSVLITRDRMLIMLCDKHGVEVEIPERVL
jgi:predicted nucleic acid-binding protein|tara:strand:+ start:554 stop:985 length:432 start_codon:yes stop_codon:yes gene_type:complete